MMKVIFVVFTPALLHSMLMMRTSVLATTNVLSELFQTKVNSLPSRVSSRYGMACGLAENQLMTILKCLQRKGRNHLNLR